jgi:hypothetical protein
MGKCRRRKERENRKGEGNFSKREMTSTILKFDGKPREHPKNNVMTFHLCCFSNSLMDDSIHLRFFQRKLIGAEAKWHFELTCNSFVNFNSLSMSFLMHF